MLKKLRIKFIAAAMCATAIVLVSIIGFINVRSYIGMRDSADEMLRLLAVNDGKFPIKQRGDPPRGDPNCADNGGKKDDLRGDVLTPEMSPETPFETRFFTVTFAADGSVQSVNTDKIAAVDTSDAEKYASELYAAGKSLGFLQNYRYLASDTAEGGKMYIFLDCRRNLETFREFLATSCVISLVGYLVVFVLVVVFSGMIMRPFAEVYAKQRRFVTDANHELKTPLTVIGAACEILEYNSGENEWTDTIKDQVGRLTELTNKLVFLSKMDEDGTHAVMTDFSLSEVAETAARPYFTLAGSRGKKFSCDIEKNLSYCGDMGMIKELFGILLDNAFKYSPDGGEVLLTLKGAGKSRRITVTNTAEGLPRGDLDMLFERFYRLDSSRNSETGGHGVGLSIARSIVTAHHGKITAASPDGKTAVFTVTL